MVFAWHVSIIKKISLYLFRRNSSVSSCSHTSEDRECDYGPLLLPHLFKRIRNVKRADFFAILEFQKFIAAMACHIDKDVRPIVREQALGPRHGGLNATLSFAQHGRKKNRVKSIKIFHRHQEGTRQGKRERESRALTGQQPQEILHRDFVSTIVDLDVLAIEIERVAAIREHAPGEVVARIAGRVVGEHEDDVRVGYAEAFHSSIPALLLFRRGHTIWDGHLRECCAHSQRIRHMLPKDFRRKDARSGPMIRTR